MNVLVPQHKTPGRFRLSESAVEELLWDPVAAIYAFYRIRLDAFQAARARIMWLTPDVEDASGFSTGKTFVNWALCNLSCMLIPDTRVIVVYQTFQIGKDQFWSYFTSHATPLARAQLGRFTEEGEEESSARAKEPSAWKMYYRNGSVLNMPAPGVYTEGRGLASLRCNRMLIDEWTKLAAMNDAVFKQLLGRPTRESWDKEHPLWCNKVWKTATAEAGAHPALPAHRAYLRRQRKGDPGVYCLAFSYKDYSGLKSATGKSFRDQYRDDKRFRAMRDQLSREAFLAEGLGLWGESARGWFTQAMIDQAVETGRSRSVYVVCSRADDASLNFQSVKPSWTQPYFFAGVDPAPAQGQRSDEGAFSVLRATPTVEVPEAESDFQLDFVYDRVVRGADIEGWSGVIHEKHADFGFVLMVMDWGGGGQWITPELRKPRQKIVGVEMQRRPIVRRDTPEIEGDPILCVVLRSDSGMQALWPEHLKHARGDDVLKSLMHEGLRQGFEKGLFGVPPRHDELVRSAREEAAAAGQGRLPLAGWSEEKVAASLTASRALGQMSKFGARTRPDGSWQLTSNGAFMFQSGDRDDLVDSRRNAYTAFRIWWAQESAGGFRMREEDAGMCTGWGGNP